MVIVAAGYGRKGFMNLRSWAPTRPEAQDLGGFQGILSPSINFNDLLSSSGHLGIDLGSFGGHFGVILGSFCTLMGHFAVTLGI